MVFIGLGALNFDRLYKVQSMASGDEEIPIHETVEEPGGSAANTIYALGKLGQPAGFIGAVGGDPEADEVLKSLKDVGVDTSHVKVKENLRTGMVIGLVDSKGERALYIAPGANNWISFKDINLDFLKGASVLHFSSFVNPEQLKVQKKIAKVLDEETKLSFAPGSLYVKKGFKAISPIIEKSHVLFLNEAEARILTGMDYEEASRFLQGKGCKLVVITLKEKGCYIAGGGESVHVPAIKTKAKDTTGAGDAFCAGFLLGMEEKRKLEECGLIGNFLASKCIQKIGARKGLPDRDEMVAGLGNIL
jgi:ribokinase